MAAASPTRPGSDAADRHRPRQGSRDGVAVERLQRRCSGTPCYAPPSPQLDPWCSGPTCQPVTLEIAGSNPVGSAIPRISLRPVRPPGRGVLHSSVRLSTAREARSACSSSSASSRSPLSCPVAGGELGFGSSSGASPSAVAAGPTSAVPASSDAGADPHRRRLGRAVRDAPTRPPRRPRASQLGRRADRAGHPLPVAGHRLEPERGRGGARRNEQALRRARARGERGRRDPGGPRRRSPRPIATRLVEARRRRDARHGPRRRTASGSPSCAPTTSGRPSGRSPGATARCSAWTGSATWRPGR